MRGGKPGHNDRLGQKTVGGKANSQVIDTEQDNRKNQIDGRTSKRNESTLPALLREKLVGRTRGFLVAGVDIGDVLSGHADVTAEREGADAPIRSASFNAKKPRTEADGKDINANAKEARDDKMSPFVNQDYDPEDKNDANKSVHASNKLRRTILTKSFATNYHCLPAVSFGSTPQPLYNRCFRGKPGNLLRSQPASFGIRSQNVVNGRKADARRASENPFDRFRDSQERHPVIQEGGHSHFVGGVQSARQRPAFLQGLPCKPQTWKTPRGHLLEVQAAKFRPVQFPFVRCQTIWIG